MEENFIDDEPLDGLKVCKNLSIFTIHLELKFVCLELRLQTNFMHLFVDVVYLFPLAFAGDHLHRADQT